MTLLRASGYLISRWADDSEEWGAIRRCIINTRRYTWLTPSMANTGHSHINGPMPGHRRRRWPNIGLALCQGFVLVGGAAPFLSGVSYHKPTSNILYYRYPVGWHQFSVLLFSNEVVYLTDHDFIFLRIFRFFF